MQDFIEQAKRVAGNAVERAAWEAEKVRRANERQHELELLQRERIALVEQLAGVVVDLAQRGQLSEGPLKALAERLRTLDTEVAHGAAEVQSIRNEAFVPGSISISVQRRGASNGNQGRAGNPANGAGAQPPAVPVTTSAAMIKCPNCGMLSRQGAAFCAQCGKRL